MTTLEWQLKGIGDIRMIDLVIIGHTDDDEIELRECLLDDAKHIVSTIGAVWIQDMTLFQGTTFHGHNAVCIVLDNPTYHTPIHAASRSDSKIGNSVMFQVIMSSIASTTMMSISL